MSKNEALREFVRRTVPKLREFGVQYVSPLRAFLRLQDTPDQVAKVIGRGMTQQSLEQELGLLLQNDKMLARCCGDVTTLAHALDTLLFGPLPDAIYYGNTLLGFGVPTNELEEQLDLLETKLYEQGDFHKTAYFHLFNVHIHPPFNHPDLDWKIQVLSYDQIKTILSPSAYREFLNCQPGHSFASIEDNEGFDTETVTSWLTRRWKEVSDFRRTLQLASDGSIDIDYVVPHFNPQWLNQIHGGGSFHMGNPRKGSNIPELKGFLHTSESEDIRSVWELSKRYRDHSQHDLSKTKERVKRAIGIAVEFFEESHRKDTPIEKFANLMIALEALYTPSDKSELTYRVSQTCAVLVGTSYIDTSPDEVYRFLKGMFNKRGSLFHGNYDATSETPEQFISGEDLARLYSLVRKSLIAYMCLYIKGNENLKELRQRLEDSVLDQGKRESLQKDSNP